MKNITFIFVLTFFFSINLKSQSNEELLNFSGRVFDDSTKQIVPLVTIHNESKRTQYAADEQGKFEILVSTNDTLVFIALGYFSKIVIVNDSIISADQTIFLAPALFEIPEAKIITTGSYNYFKQRVKNLNLPETEIDSITRDLNYQVKTISIETDIEKENREAMSRPTTEFLRYSFPIRTKKEKDQKELNKIKELKKNQKIIQEKFNRELVHNLTKLEGKELTDFITYCNFSDEYLLNTNTYDIAKEVLIKFELYNLKKQD